MSYIGNPPIVQASRVITELVATAGQTDIYPLGGYTPGDYLDVEINGSALKSTDYTATDGVKITLAVAMAAGDDVRVKAYGNFLVGNATPADGTVSTVKLAALAVTTAKIADANVTTAKVADAAVTQAKLDAAVVPVGVGQSWQDLSASRALATTYTNTTGRPIMVSVLLASNGSWSGSLLVNGVSIAGTYFVSGGGTMTMTTVVPNGATYRANASIALGGWFELR